MKGLDLCEQFYFKVIKPILAKDFSCLPYVAGLLGNGSEILGYDTELSTDHDFGPRGILFLSEVDISKYKQIIDDQLCMKLPRTFENFPTSFVPSEDEEGSADVFLPDKSETNGPVNHKIVITTVREFVWNQLGFDVNKALDFEDWLTFPEQKLLSLTCGRIFDRVNCTSNIESKTFDNEIGLDAIRNKLEYFPRTVWLYVYASCWLRVENESHLMCRAGHVGDELGSTVIAGRIVHDLMRLCFLLCRQYAPYPKWFGSKFSQLDFSLLSLRSDNESSTSSTPYINLTSSSLQKILLNVLRSTEWESRMGYMCEAYEYIAKLHNSKRSELKLPFITDRVKPFHTRPFQVISMGEISTSILSTLELEVGTIVNITNNCIDDNNMNIETPIPTKDLPMFLSNMSCIGNIDQICDNCVLTENSKHRSSILGLFK